MWKLLPIIKRHGMFVTGIILTIFMFIITVGFYHYNAVTLFRYGMDPAGNSSVFGKVLISIFFYLTFYLVFIVSSLVIVVILMIRRKFLFGVVCLCLFLAVNSQALVSYVNRKPGIYYILQGLVDRVEKDIDFKAIRQWANNINISKYSGWPGVPKTNWPPTIVDLNPNTVFVKITKESGRKILLEWGGPPMGHWGLVIGTTEMINPLSHIQQDGEYRYAVEKGVYVWCELKSEKFTFVPAKQM